MKRSAERSADKRGRSGVVWEGMHRPMIRKKPENRCLEVELRSGGMDGKSPERWSGGGQGDRGRTGRILRNAPGTLQPPGPSLQEGTIPPSQGNPSIPGSPGDSVAARETRNSVKNEWMPENWVKGRDLTNPSFSNPTSHPFSPLPTPLLLETSDESASPSSSILFVKFFLSGE